MEWYIPITILPGIALPILSTSNFIIALNNEIIGLKNLAPHKNHEVIVKKIKQMARLSRAIVSFYISVASFTLSGLMKSLFTFIINYQIFFKATIAIGIITLLIGITILIIYAIKAVQIRQEQFNQLFGKE